jgi:hypothetical protein
MKGRGGAAISNSPHSEERSPHSLGDSPRSTEKLPPYRRSADELATHLKLTP